MTKEIQEESVDIEKEAEAGGLKTFSDAELDRIYKRNKIAARWFKQRAILLLSAAVILTVSLTSIYAIVFSDDTTSQDWGRQVLSTLVGFAAGAMWPNSARSDDE